MMGCGHCGLPNTPEGHDGCLGTLPGVMNACCGHGKSRGYVQFRLTWQTPTPPEGYPPYANLIETLRVVAKCLSGEAEFEVVHHGDFTSLRMTMQAYRKLLYPELARGVSTE